MSLEESTFQASCVARVARSQSHPRSPSRSSRSSRAPTPSTDPVHFDCPGADHRSDSILAFQKLWNVNNPGDKIAEDGSYGPATESRLAKSPAGGFPIADDCTTPPPTPDWAGAFVDQSFP